MQVARVVGTVVCTHKDERLAGVTLLVIQPLAKDGTAFGRTLVATDAAGAGVARDIATHIAAFSPTYLTRDEVSADVVANERHIAEETARNEGKPEAALPKIIEGRLNGFFKDVVLLDQPSVSDNKKSVKALLDEAGVTVARFVRFEVGQP